ncbi:MAG: hypothetical protein ACTS22_01240 [Phycisphaerales bacterium]
MNDDRFQLEFWAGYDAVARPTIERACTTHLRRTGSRVDPDDMRSWIDARVWKLLRERPNAIIRAEDGPNEALVRVRDAAALLARWACLAHGRSAARRSRREIGAEDIEAVHALSLARAEPAAFEREERVCEALDALRRRASADLRAKLAASWKDPADRARIAAAIDAQRPEDHELRDRVARGAIKENTVQQMRSRSLRAARGLFDNPTRYLAVLLVALLTGAAMVGDAAAGNDDEGGEQTGGRSAHAADSPS